MKLCLAAVLAMGFCGYVLGATIPPPGFQTGLTDAEIEQFHSVNHNDSEYAVSVGDNWSITSDGLVDSAEKHLFPGNRNPNSVAQQRHNWTVPKVVTYREQAACLPMGAIGIAVDGVPFYNPFTIQQTDAVVNEQFDACKGHPDPHGTYHYHQNSDCIQHRDDDKTPNKLIGVALDGIPIYGMYDENGEELTSADLDDCHGAPLSTTDTRYVYRATRGFPYLLGCFWGTASSSGRGQCSTAVADVTNGELGPGGAAGPGAGNDGNNGGGVVPPSGGGEGGQRPPPPPRGNNGGRRPPSPPKGDGRRPPAPPPRRPPPPPRRPPPPGQSQQGPPPRPEQSKQGPPPRPGQSQQGPPPRPGQSQQGPPPRTGQSQQGPPPRPGQSQQGPPPRPGQSQQGPPPRPGQSQQGPPPRTGQSQQGPPLRPGQGRLPLPRSQRGPPPRPGRSQRGPRP